MSSFGSVVYNFFTRVNGEKFSIFEYLFAMDTLQKAHLESPSIIFAAINKYDNQ